MRPGYEDCPDCGQELLQTADSCPYCAKVFHDAHFEPFRRRSLFMIIVAASGVISAGMLRMYYRRLLRERRRQNRP